MKKVGIVTVFYTENCGSVLQAKCLADKLKENNCDVYYISTVNSLSGHSFKRLIKNCIKKIRSNESVKLSINKYYSYSKFIKRNFHIIKNKHINELDLIIFGSDTIWDVESDYFMLSQNVFWGMNFNQLKKSSYAASIANSPYELLDSLKYPVDQLEKFDNISVRDNYSLNYISSRVDKNVEMVCDPTLLFDKDYYNQYIKDISFDNYLLMYLFNEPSQEIKKQIIDFCKNKKLRIVCLIGIGKMISFADEYVESTIDNFITYFVNADYIVTNTFHGTVFSIIFNKKFVTLDYHKTKIAELLNQLNISERLISSNLESSLIKEINYNEVENKLKSIRQNSENYIERILK